MGAYRSLLAGAGARRLALASALGWLGFGALSLAIVLTVQRAAGSSSAAGAALAAFALGSGVLAPARGRLVDRYGPRRALVPFAVASGAALLGLALAAEEGAPTWLLVALAALGGLTVPPLIASARVVWPQVVAPEALPPAYGVQALLGDLGGVGGPALAGAVAALASPSGALIACALLPVAGAVLLARPAVARAHAARGPGRSAGEPGHAHARARRRSGSTPGSARSRWRCRRWRRARARPPRPRCRWRRSRPRAPSRRWSTARGRPRRAGATCSARSR